ncbi:hypothetical protein ABZ756_12085 [Mammaliicoccus sciuri]
MTIRNIAEVAGLSLGALRHYYSPRRLACLCSDARAGKGYRPD